LIFAIHIPFEHPSTRVLDKGYSKMIYLNALVGTLFLTLEAGVLLEGITWMGLNAFHASRAILTSGEAIMLLPVIILFFFIFKNALSAEKDIVKGNL